MIALPKSSPATHSDVEGHERLSILPSVSISTGVLQLGVAEVGSVVMVIERSPTATHSSVEGHETFVSSLPR